MIPVEQTIAHHVYGDCFAAALASILEVDLDKIPPWSGGLAWGDYRPRLDEWLATRGLTSYACPVLPAPMPLSGLDVPRGAILLAGVRTPGDWNHALVVRDGEVVWDPYPAGNPEVGLLGGRDPLVDFVFLLIPLDPARALDVAA